MTYQKAFRFYGRDTNGKYQLDVDELRSVFLLSASAAERLKLFRIERIAKIVAGDTPLPLENGPKMITHILPLAAFTSRTVVDLNLLWRDTSSLVGLLPRSSMSTGCCSAHAKQRGHGTCGCFEMGALK